MRVEYEILLPENMSLLIGLTLACAPTQLQGQAPRSPTPLSATGVVDVQPIAKGLEHPSSLAFLPDKRMLVTERPGGLRIVGADGWLSEPLTGVPKVYASGQGGILDVALESVFAKDRFIYLSFAESGEGGASDCRSAGAAWGARPRKHAGDLASATQSERPQSLGIAHRVSPRRHLVRDFGRALQLFRESPGSIRDFR